MTNMNINNIQKMAIGSPEWQALHAKMGEIKNSKVDDEDTLFQTMQYYELTNRSDNWSTEAQNLDVKELIKLWKEFDKEDTTFAKDFDEFDAFMTTYKPDTPEPPVEEDIIRPYIPKPLTPEQEARMEEFDKMRANDVHSKLDKEGDYELLLEYARQREGTSFLYPSDYNADGTVNDKGKAKEADMIAKLAELDKADNDLGDVLEDFLKAYNVEEPTGAATNGELPDVKGEVANILAGASSELVIGDNKYLVTNKGANDNKLAYEVKTNKQGEKYIEMNGNDWRIQDISGQLQDDLIQINGERNELDLGLGDDIAHLVGNDNRALMGDGDDKVYIEGDNTFSDLWRGDDQLFNINSNNTLSAGFTGNDEMYIKGNNVAVSGENNTVIGDGIYKDGKITDHEMENVLEKPDWFPDPDNTEPGVVEEDGPVDIEFDGIKYRVYKKTGDYADPTAKLTYYKADDGRTVFESNGWDITVVSEDNTTGDGKYTDVVVKGDRNSFHGSLSEDAIEIQGNGNNIYGDYSHVKGDDDEITITNGTNNWIYGEVGNDTVTTKTEGNFFNQAILDVEKANGEEQDLTPPQKPSAWQTVTEPNDSQIAQMNAVKEAFDIPDDATFKKVQQNGTTMGMSYNKQAYLSKTNADGSIASITKKDNGETLAKVEYEYATDGSVKSTKMTDYVNNTITITEADGNKTVTKYDDVTNKNPVPSLSTTTTPDGQQINQVIDKENNTLTITNPDGSSEVIKYDNITSNTRKPISSEIKDVDGNVVATNEYDHDKDTAVRTEADGSKIVWTYDDMTIANSLKTKEYYDAKGNLVTTEAYKNGKLDMIMPQGKIMTAQEFFNELDMDDSKKITQSEIRDLYNSSDNPHLKGILSNFTDGNEMTFAYQLAATGSGSAAYAKDKELTLADIKKMVADKDGNITSDSLKELQTSAAYATLVGGNVTTEWFVNGSDSALTNVKESDVVYALTNKEGKEFDDLTMILLNAAGGKSVNRADLAEYGIKTVADYQNKELFKDIREGADILAAVGFKAKGSGFTVPTAQQVYNIYRNTNDENVKKACVKTGLITVGTDGLPRVIKGATSFTGDVRALYKDVLIDIVGYSNLKKEENA